MNHITEILKLFLKGTETAPGGLTTRPGSMPRLMQTAAGRYGYAGLPYAYRGGRKVPYYNQDLVSLLTQLGKQFFQTGRRMRQ